MLWREILAQLKSKLLTPSELASFFSRLFDVVLIVIGAILLNALARAVVRRLLKRSHKGRAATFINLSHSLIGYVVFFIALILILRVFGVDYAAIIAGAGVVGLAVGFGAQTLIRDFISGFFLLVEDLIEVGDYITVGDVAGTVELVGLRVTRIRAFDGTLHVVPNGELTRFGNRSRDFMRAIVTFDLAYEQDAEKGLAITRRVAEEWHRENADAAVEPPEVFGLLNLGESGVQARVAVKVWPGRQWEVERQLRLRLKQAFDSSGVEIPFARQVVYLRSESESPDRPAT